jgi:hypothetical protein
MQQEQQRRQAGLDARSARQQDPDRDDKHRRKRDAGSAKRKARVGRPLDEVIHLWPPILGHL